MWTRLSNAAAGTPLRSRPPESPSDRAFSRPPAFPVFTNRALIASQAAPARYIGRSGATGASRGWGEAAAHTQPTSGSGVRTADHPGSSHDDAGHGPPDGREGADR